jgi:hypothetical protein
MLHDRIRLLAPLAFDSPRIISTIIDGTVPADLLVNCTLRPERLNLTSAQLVARMACCEHW